MANTSPLKHRIFFSTGKGTGYHKSFYALALCDILLQYDIAKISLRRMEMDAVLFLHRRPVRDLLYLSGDGRAEFTAEK